MNTKLWRKLHRWAGLILAGFVVFYCVTGLLLNHRQTFNYFQARQQSVVRVEVRNQDIMQGVIDSYKEQINRTDNPEVIRIKEGGVIEFLYGSHGRITYTIDPRAGTMTRVDKSDKQPWYWLNRLHKSYKTSVFWLMLTDFIGLLIILLTLTGLLFLRYTRHDFLMLLGGLVLLFFGIAVA